MAEAANKKFDYELVKTRFLDQVKKDISTSVFTVNSPWSRAMVDKIINAIVKGDEAMKQNEAVDTFQWKALYKYDVVDAAQSSLRGKVDNSTKVLVLRETNHKKQSYKAIIPSEECYDIIAQSHLKTKHGSYKRMLQLIQEEYAVKPSNISLLINVCNVCNNKGIDTLNEYEFRSYYAFIIDFSQYPDNQFQYVLVLAVKSNNFVHIRPLVSKENIEIAIELLKIFMDFGPPFELITNEYALFHCALDVMFKICPDIKINIESSHDPVFAKIEKQVKHGIRDWIIECHSRHWSTGCRMVQWEMNNTPIGEVTPYECLFGGVPNDSLSTKPTWAVSKTEDSEYQKMIKLFDELYMVEDGNEGSSEGADNIKGHNRYNKVSHCQVCRFEVRRVTTCHKCDKYMHTICGVRLIIDKNVVTVCPKCNIS